MKTILMKTSIYVKLMIISKNMIPTELNYFSNSLLEYLEITLTLDRK